VKALLVWSSSALTSVPDPSEKEHCRPPLLLVLPVSITERHGRPGKALERLRRLTRSEGRLERPTGVSHLPSDSASSPVSTSAASTRGAPVPPDAATDLARDPARLAAPPGSRC
jgi:hypothetical protein